MTSAAANLDRDRPFNILAALYTVPGLMTVGSIATLLGKSTKSIRRMVSSRQIPFLRIGSELRFDPSAISLWLSRQDATLAQAARQFGMNL